MFLSPLSEHEVAVAVPPTRFRGVVGKPTRVALVGTKCKVPSSQNTAAQVNGLRYESRVHSELSRKVSGYLENPRLIFFDAVAARSCIPDGIILLADRAVLVEVKLSHMPEAWWQLKRLYEPVVRNWSRAAGLPIQFVEIVRSFDPAVPFPAPVHLFADLDEVISGPVLSNEFGVLVWKL